MKLFFRLSFLFALIVSAATFGYAQKVLILEKRGSLKTIRFYEGDEITYRTAGDKEWQTATISELIPDDNILVMERSYINLEKIEALQKRKNQTWTKGLSTNLYVFGAAWTTYTAIDDLVVNSRETDWEAAAYAGGGSLLLGTILRLLPTKKTIKINERRRLRMLNLTPMPVSE